MASDDLEAQKDQEEKKGEEGGTNASDDLEAKKDQEEKKGEEEGTLASDNLDAKKDQEEKKGEEEGLRAFDDLGSKTFLARETYFPYDDGPRRAGSVVFRCVRNEDHFIVSGVTTKMDPVHIFPFLLPFNPKSCPACSLCSRSNLIVTFNSMDKLKFIHNEDHNTGCIVIHEKTNKKVIVILHSVRLSFRLSFFLLPGFRLQ